MTKYPASIDTTITLPLVADNSTPVQAETVNRLRNAIVAIEAELGVKPSGVYTTVRARLDALDAAINALVISGVDGDVEGGLATTKVVGFGGRPFSDSAPTVNQVISWNGIAWVPSTLSNIVLNVLPTSVLLPNDANFLAGDGYSTFSSPTRVGSRGIDLALWPATWPDGRTRTMKFIADLEVTNPLTDGYVQLKDVTHNAVIFNSLLTTDSLSSVELSAIITSGETDGYMREDCCDLTIYEVQIYVLGGDGTTDQVICRNARIEFTYTAPILVTALLPLALPTDLNFVAGTTLNGFTTPAGVGGRNIDMSKFPLALPDNRIRTVKFHADVEVSAPGVDGYIQLYDTTHNVLVTGTQFQFTNTIVNEVSATLVVGALSGNIRNDSLTRYEVRIWKVSGAPTDRVICNNARVTITYA